MSKYTIESSTLTAIADAIRIQYQDDSPISPLDFAEAILGIEGGGGGGESYDFYYEDGEISLTSGSRTISIETEHDIGEILYVMILPTNPSDLDRRTCCYGFIYDEHFGERTIFSDATSSSSPFVTYLENKNTTINVNGSVLTYTSYYSYRPLPAIDYFYRIIYK